MEYRALTVRLADMSGANTITIPCPYTGVVKQFYTAVSGDPGAATVISGNINGGSAFDGTLTVGNGSSAHEVDASAAVTTNNAVAAGEGIRFVSNGAATNAESLEITVLIQIT